MQTQEAFTADTPMRVAFQNLTTAQHLRRQAEAEPQNAPLYERVACKYAQHARDLIAEARPAATGRASQHHSMREPKSWAPRLTIR